MSSIDDIRARLDAYTVSLDSQPWQGVELGRTNRAMDDLYRHAEDDIAWLLDRLAEAQREAAQWQAAASAEADAVDEARAELAEARRENNRWAAFARAITKREQQS